VFCVRGFPRASSGLRAVPGIGPYTAAAVAAIAFGEAVVPTDGNVERIVARLRADPAPLPGAKARFDAAAQLWMQHPEARARPGDFAQALFDLGATICTPKRPACALCPWSTDCAAHAAGVAESLPRKAAKPERPLRHGVHFLLDDAAGRVLTRRRPAEGLLGGMLEIPGTPWRNTPWTEAEALRHAPLPASGWQAAPGTAEHGFTHFLLRLTLFTSRWNGMPPQGFAWLPRDAARTAMPTVMRKLLLLGRD
jgi:A/G-specific adenine glycosylase